MWTYIIIYIVERTNYNFILKQNRRQTDLGTQLKRVNYHSMRREIRKITIVNYCPWDNYENKENLISK